MRRLGHHFSIFHSKLSVFIPNFLTGLAKLSLAYSILIAGLCAVAGTATASAGDRGGLIPGDAIRIRILANSDSPYDQAVKRGVRDRVARVIASWGPMPGTHDAARAMIASHLDEVQAAADAALAERGVPYGAKVELKKVSFPAKEFEGRAYAAGEYEALRISLGGANGANWWCVLFPPLCLTAATASEKQVSPPAPSAARSAAPAAAAKAESGNAVARAQSAKEKPSASVSLGADRDENGGKPKPKFFLAELIGKLAHFVKSLFA